MCVCVYVPCCAVLCCAVLHCVALRRVILSQFYCCFSVVVCCIVIVVLLVVWLLYGEKTRSHVCDGSKKKKTISVIIHKLHKRIYLHYGFKLIQKIHPHKITVVSV